MTIQQQFQKMTTEQHRELKERLFKLAALGEPRPAEDTLEGYALKEYTTPTTENIAHFRGVEYGRARATNQWHGVFFPSPDWPLSGDLTGLDGKDAGIGQVPVPPEIYADADLRNAYCGGVVYGFQKRSL
jgi:hypothetical protein